MKKVMVVLLLSMNIVTFGKNCEDRLLFAKNRLLELLNMSIRPKEAQIAYNTMVNNYKVALGGASGCMSNVINHLHLIAKIENIQSTLDIQINNNFNGSHQIPYNPNYTYNGSEYEYEIKRGDIEDSTGNTYVSEKRQSNTAIDGVDHVGLIKYMYGIAGINTGTFNELEMDDFAGMTKYQLRRGVPLKQGDLLVMNYNNDASLDTIGLVYKDKNGHLKMLEMGGNINEPGSSVKSMIPLTDGRNTVYVVPFETVMNKAYSVDDLTDLRELRDIKDSVMSRGKILTLPLTNPNITVYSKPRNQIYLTDNGYTSATILPNPITKVDSKIVLDQIKEMGMEFSTISERAYSGISAIVMSVMLFLITINLLWRILKEGLHGSAEEIVKSILSQVALKSPYFVFVALYPILMKNIVIPLFLYKIPTYLFGDFITVSKISMGNGKYITYSDMIVHVMNKGVPLVIGTFGAGIIKQKDALGGLFGFFKTVWKVIGGWFTDPQSIIYNAMETLGLLYSISRVVTQTVFYRPISALSGLMTIITLLSIVLNIFLSSFTFIISTSVGLFYMIFGMSDITKDKSLHTLQIIVSGFMQYLINFCVVIVFAMIVEMLGKETLGTIITPFNFVKTIKVFICISMILNISRQIGTSIAKSL